MARVCRGGLYNGMPILGLEDEISCRENEGVVVEAPGPTGGGGCGTTTVAHSAVSGSSVAGGSSAFTFMVTSSLRQVRDRYRASRLVTVLDDINNEIGPVLSNLMKTDAGFQRDLFGLFVDIAMLAGELRAGAPGQSNGIYSQSLHDRLSQVVARIQDSDAAAPLRDRLTEALDLAKPLVGLSSSEVGAALEAEIGKA